MKQIRETEFVYLLLCADNVNNNIQVCWKNWWKHVVSGSLNFKDTKVNEKSSNIAIGGLQLFSEAKPFHYFIIMFVPKLQP